MNLFDIVGINQDDRGENLIVLTPSDHMLVPDFPGLPEDGCTITFERDVALSREDAQFITWEHPLIRNGLDLSAVNRHTGSKLVNAVQQDVHAILQQGEAQIAKAAQGLIDAARNEADEKLTAELSRLEALKAVNPNIRDDELAAIESNRQQVMDALAQAGWRLDALRLIVVTHQ